MKSRYTAKYFTLSHWCSKENMQTWSKKKVLVNNKKTKLWFTGKFSRMLCPFPCACNRYCPVMLVFWSYSSSFFSYFLLYKNIFAMTKTKWIIYIIYSFLVIAKVYFYWWIVRKDVSVNQTAVFVTLTSKFFFCNSKILNASPYISKKVLVNRICDVFHTVTFSAYTPRITTCFWIGWVRTSCIPFRWRCIFSTDSKMHC